MDKTLETVNKIFKWNAEEVSDKLEKKLERLKCCGNCRYHTNDWENLNCTFHKSGYNFDHYTNYDNVCPDWILENDLRWRENVCK